MLAPDADAADVVVPVDELLQDHRLEPGLVVGRDELLDRVDDEHVLPAAARVGLQHRRQARVADQRLPVQRELEVAERPLLVDVGDVLLVGQHDRLRHRDPELARERALEELLVRLPPEGVVDDHGAHEHRALQVGAVVGHLMGDPVHEHGVVLLGQLRGAAENRQLGADPLGRTAVVDEVEKRHRESVLASDQQADDLLFRHSPFPLRRPQAR